jgi:hypothetical protein
MIAEQLIDDAIILNAWIKENRLSIKDYAGILNYYFENIVKFKWQNEPNYILKLQKKLRYEQI